MVTTSHVNSNSTYTSSKNVEQTKKIVLSLIHQHYSKEEELLNFTVTLKCENCRNFSVLGPASIKIAVAVVS